MWTILQLLASLCICVKAASFIQPEWGYYYEQDDQGPGTYSYGYDIEDPVTRNIQFRRERRMPNGTVTGSYGLVEADGNIRIVHYTADNYGYRTTIENSQRPNEMYPPAAERTWGGSGQRPPWDTLWYRDRPYWDTAPWYRQQSPFLSHALASLQAPDSPVLEERTPPALRGEQQKVIGGDEVSVPEEESQENSYLSYAPDQSQDFPVYDLPSDYGEGSASVS